MTHEAKGGYMKSEGWPLTPAYALASILLCTQVWAQDDPTGQREAGHWPDGGVVYSGGKRPATTERVRLLRSELGVPSTVSGDERSVQLVEAARSGNAAAVARLLNSGALPNARTAEGRVAITASVESGNFETMRELIDKGADVNVKDGAGNTALATAALSGHDRMVRYLLKSGARPDAKADNGCTPLLNAALMGRAEAARLLLSAGADPSIRNRDGWPALVLAARGIHIETMRALIDARADPNILGRDSLSPLYWAIFRRSRPAAELLVKSGADVGALSLEVLD